MTAFLSQRSKSLRTDAAYGLAIHFVKSAREDPVFTFSYDLVDVPPRLGFALRDVLDASGIPTEPISALLSKTTL